MRSPSFPWPTDELGPLAVHILRLPDGAEAYVVVDNLALGVAIGGTRMLPTVTPVEVARLARAMTIKNAVAGLPHGGAKSGIRTRRGLTGREREPVVRAFAQAIRTITDYVPGPDMGTDETAMAWIRDEIGRAVGLPSVLGGVPLDEVGATGYGVAVCADELSRAGRLELAGARVAVQGFGAVGRHAAIQLAKRGARIVAVSDITGAVQDPDGLDLAALIEFKRSGSGSLAEFPGAKPLERDALIAAECDILVPAAQADVIDVNNADLVRARVILQGANLPATADAEAIFAARGVLSIPDVVANAGGVICAAVELRGGTRDEAFRAITEKISANTAELLDRTATAAISPRQAALAMARERLGAAAEYHRHF
jgi:glutamate dehydrogenase/leucine dehydrogenase